MRSARVESSGHPSAAFDLDLDQRQAGIAAIFEAADVDDRLDLAAEAIGHGLGQALLLPGLVGRAALEGLVRTMLVVPECESVESLLNAARVQRQQCGPQPELEGAEESFDLAVDGRTSHAALDMVDAHRFDSPLERAAELAAVVGDEVSWLAVCGGRAAYETDHVPRVGRAAIDAQGHQFAAEAVDDGRDGEAKGQELPACQVKMPDMVNAPRAQEPLGRLALREFP